MTDKTEKRILCNCKIADLEKDVCVEMRETAYNAIKKALEVSPHVSVFQWLGRPYNAEETARIDALWRDEKGFPDSAPCALCGKDIPAARFNNPYPLCADNPDYMVCGDCVQSYVIPARFMVSCAGGRNE